MIGFEIVLSLSVITFAIVTFTWPELLVVYEEYFLAKRNRLIHTELCVLKDLVMSHMILLIVGKFAKAVLQSLPSGLG